VVAVRLDPPPASVEVGQDRVEVEDPLLVVPQLRGADRRGETLLEALEVAVGQDVGEGVDLPHRSILATPAAVDSRFPAAVTEMPSAQGPLPHSPGARPGSREARS